MKQLIFQKGPIELWRHAYGRYDRPIFIVISPEGDKDFPSYCNPNNLQQALDYLKELRVKYEV